MMSCNLYAAPNAQYGLVSSNPINQTDLNSATKKAIFRQIFNNGLEKIIANVNNQKLKNNSWGVVFGLEGTLIDNSRLATPGAPQVTCKIIKLGGIVSIVTNRSGQVANNNDFILQTTKILDKQGICYSNVVFANNNNDTNKNPRFRAISSGDYENVFTSKRLEPIQIVGYFGTEIEGFPDLKQNLANTLPVSDPIFSPFGQQYFMLPR